MEVYKIEFESDRFQCLCYDGDESESVFLPGCALYFDGSSKVAGWSPPPVTVVNPQAKKGDFLSSFPGCLAVRQSAVDQLRDVFALAGELLPLGIEAEMGAILNITTITDCLDHEKSEWAMAKDGVTRLLCRRFVFSPNALPESSLFKIPDLSAPMFVHTGGANSELNFYHQVRRRKLKGLRFKRVWETDSI